MSSGQTRRLMLFALRRLLRPLARLLMRFGIRFDDLASIAQQIYIESAIRDFGSQSALSRARASALTGLTGLIVDRYVDGEGSKPAADPTMRALLVEVLHKWHTVAEYGGPYGIPLELGLDAPANRCLRSLIALVNPKANPNAVLEELLRDGSILGSREKGFRPASRFFMMPDPTSPRLMERFGMTLSRLAATLEYNMDPGHPDKRLQRRVSADRALPLEFVPAFEKYARDKAANFLLELDNWLALRSTEGSEAGNLADTGVSVFLYVEPLAKEDPLATLIPASNATGAGR